MRSAGLYPLEFRQIMFLPLLLTSPALKAPSEKRERTIRGCYHVIIQRKGYLKYIGNYSYVQRLFKLLLFLPGLNNVVKFLNYLLFLSQSVKSKKFLEFCVLSFFLLLPTRFP